MITPTTLFKCLADETRLRCVVLLRKEGRLCVCELTHALDLLQPKISRHLAQLRQSNLLLDSREGQWVYYQINPELPAWVFEILDVTVKQLATNAKQQKDSGRLQAMGGRPEMTKYCN
ncbi:MAG: metalloregulator ArsR/SmtB family transcription factor [Methylobacter sp.]|nr:metalloregulator ArsR/SmtB family transcription factor [Methylobacter sp.]